MELGGTHGSVLSVFTVTFTTTREESVARAIGTKDQAGRFHGELPY